MVEMVERVTAAILPAFAHIPDPEYRKTIATCWARAAMTAMDVPTEEMVVTGDEAAIEVLNDHSFALRAETLAARVYRAMVKIAHKPDRVKAISDYETEWKSILERLKTDLEK